MTSLSLNVGLNRNDGQAPNGIMHTIAVLNQGGLLLRSGEVLDQPDERVLVGHFDFIGRQPIAHALYGVAVRLHQDCLAAATFDSFGTITGDLHGPDSVKWGPFDSSKFILHNPQRITA